MNATSAIGSPTPKASRKAFKFRVLWFFYLASFVVLCYLIAQARHRRARADETRKQRLERTFVPRFDGLRGTIAHPAQFEALSGDGGKHAKPPHGRIVQRLRCGDDTTPRTVVFLSECLGHQDAIAILATALVGRAGRVPATLASQPALATTRRSVEDSTKITTASASVVSMIAVAVSRGQQLGEYRRIHEAPDDALLGVGGEGWLR